jgi:hypothetical protein
MVTEETAAEYLKREEEEMERQRQEHQARREAQEAQEKAEAQAEVGRRKAEFATHVASFGSDIDAALASQAERLHGIFAHALDAYAGAGDEARAKLYSGIALRAQNYCRMTLTAMVRMKEYSAYTTITGKNKKIEERPIINDAPEAPDATGTPSPGETVPSPAAL